MTISGKTWKDQRKHRRKVAGTEQGKQEHEKRNKRRGKRRPKTIGSIKYTRSVQPKRQSKVAD